MEKIVFESDGKKLIGVIEYPEKTPAPAVVMLHGMTNNKDDCPLMRETTDMLLREGFIVFRFDQFGSGESPGLFKDKLMSILAKNGNDAVEFLSKNDKVTDIGLWGISIGGVIITLMGNNPKVKSTALLSPSFSLVREFKRESDQPGEYVPLAEDPKTNKVTTGKVKGEALLWRKFFDELPELDKKAQKVLSKMKKVLTIHGSDDLLVNPLCSIEIYNLVKEPRELHMIWGAGHNCKGAKQETIGIVKKWFVDHLKL